MAQYILGLSMRAAELIFYVPVKTSLYISVQIAIFCAGLLVHFLVSGIHCHKVENQLICSPWHIMCLL